MVSDDWYGAWLLQILHLKVCKTAIAEPGFRARKRPGGREFKRFHRTQAVAFKAKLADAVNARTGERISKATMLSTLRDLRAFFFWLANVPGFKFNLSDKDVAVARARREKRVPTLTQVHHVLSSTHAATVLERRGRALIAFTALTGARTGASALKTMLNPADCTQTMPDPAAD